MASDFLARFGRVQQSITRRFYPAGEFADTQRVLAGQGFGSLVVKGTYTGLVFLLTLLLARLLGTRGFGAYSYAVAVIEVLAIFAVMGFDTELVRRVPPYLYRKEWGAVRGILRRAQEIVLLNALVIGSFTWMAVWLFGQKHLTETGVLSLYVACFLLPVWALLRVREGSIQGFQRVVVSLVCSSIIQPGLLALLVLACFLMLRDKFTAPVAMVTNVASFGVSVIVAGFLLKQTVPGHIRRAASEFDTARWIRSAASICLIGGIYIINARTDLIMIGTIKGEQLAGIYATASRASTLIGLVVFCVNSALCPLVSSLNSSGDMRALRQLVPRSARMTFLCSLPIAFGLIVFGKPFLSIFGPDFATGSTALIVLTCGQLFLAATGPAIAVLVMCGLDRDAVTGLAVATCLNLALNALLVPIWGIEGGAVATTCSVVVGQTILAVQVYRRLGVHSHVFARTREES